MRVEIDPGAGFCGGVIRAISTAEDFLSRPGHGSLYSLGPIVHNEEELSRLRGQGLGDMSLEDLALSRPAAGGETLLIRAHGEPPSTYSRAEELGFTVIDCTCPVVLRLQSRIRSAYASLKRSGGTLVIFGKIGHAEVLGLLGQVDGDAVVVENLEMLREVDAGGRIDWTRPVEIFSQTTKSPDGYALICEALRSRMSDPAALKVHQTICRQVASRHRRLSEFALAHDVVVFVCGRMSSNGAVLCELCRAHNLRTYRVENAEAVRKEWFRPEDSVGVSGATSTPKWLLEQVAERIGGFFP